jgi:hypothetical protein
MDEYDNNDYGTEIDDSQRLDELSTMEDYNRWEEEQVARDMDMGEGEPDSDYENDYPEVDDGSMSDQLMDQEMEDRIGGTGYLECE